MDDYCKFSGLNSAVRYFVDPDSPEGKKAAADKAAAAKAEKEKADTIEQIMVKAQADVAQAEVTKAQAQQQNVMLKNDVEQGKNALTHQKQQFEARIDALEARLQLSKDASDAANKTADRNQRKREADQRTALELTRIEKDSEKEENENFEGNRESAA